jgi:hypothetical protein
MAKESISKSPSKSKLILSKSSNIYVENNEFRSDYRKDKVYYLVFLN